MFNVEEVIQVISLVLNVAGFLLNTSRFQKAIELCKECLFILEEKTGIKDEQLRKLFYKRIYFTMWKACSLISDNTNAIKYVEKILQIYRESGERLEECKLSIELAGMYFHDHRFAQAKQLFEKARLISKETGDSMLEACSYENLGTVYHSVGEYKKAREHLEKSLAIQKEIEDRSGEATSYAHLRAVFQSVGKYEQARKQPAEKSLVIHNEPGETKREASCLASLGTVYISVGEYQKAKEHLEKSLEIQKEIGDRNGEAMSYENLGAVYRSVGEYEKAREHLEKSLAIQKEIGDRKGEASSYVNLGTVYRSVGEYEKAREHFEKSLAIHEEIRDRKGEASCLASLGTAYRSVGEYHKATEHLEKSLAIQKEIGDRSGEATSYENLGAVYRSVGEYHKARKHLEKSLAIQKEIGDRSGEATSYENLGAVYRSVGEYEKAREHLEKSLAIQKEIGDRRGEAMSYENLGAVYRSVGEYEKAREHLEKSLEIHKEIGDRNGEAMSFENLGAVYRSVGDYKKARDHFEKSLSISRRTGDRRLQTLSYLDLGDMLCALGKYSKANQYNQKALVILEEIGDREGMAKSNINQGTVFACIGKFIKAKECFERALATSKEIGNREVEATGCTSLGCLLLDQNEHVRAEEFIKRGLVLGEEVGDIARQFHSLEMLALIKLKEGKIQEAISYFLSGIGKCEEIRGSLRDNDQFKISFSDCNSRSYKELSVLLCKTENPTDALYVSELSRARGLADLMSAQYSVEHQISANPRSWTGLQNILAKACNRTCLYLSYHSDSMYLWILKADGVTHLQTINGKDLIALEGLGEQLEEFFDCRKSGPGSSMNLPLCYKLIIAPVVDYLEGPEIIIVPDRALYRIPFAALTDESGKYLTETFRIRIAPSLTTLKLINESPADYHCQTGALIVGNPDVGMVHFEGLRTHISRLPCTENEAKMIAEKLDVVPLLGQQATKEAVLQSMNSVALIHIAAHGDAERGEIFLTPSFRIPNGTPREELYLLKTTDISKVQLRAKLVVLSCAHSACGQTKAEGAVGIARAFLGSGARSVLVALGALHDEATEKLMTHFYDHLVSGESAGESLHKAMKWMRSEGYDVDEWASFILIGDDVTFDFGKKGVDKNGQVSSEGSHDKQPME